MYFYEEDKTEVYFSITMELNEVADPFEMTDTFRYLLTNDNFVLCKSKQYCVKYKYSI